MIRATTEHLNFFLSKLILCVAAAATSVGCATEPATVERVQSLGQALVVNGELTHERPVGIFFSVTGKKYLSWVGTDQRINFMTSIADDVWAEKLTLNELVESGSGIALAEFDGRLFVAWTGTDNRINLLSSADGVTWSQKVTFTDESDHAPALAAHDGKLFIAHTGNDEHIYVRSSSDGTSFTGTTDLDELSENGPSITSFSGHLLVGWTGTNEHLNMVELDPSSHAKSSDKFVLTETSEDGLWILGFGAELLLSWRGSGNEQLNFAVVPECELFERLATGGSVADFKTTVSDISEIGPTVADFDGSAALLWKGTDDQVNTRENIAERVEDTDPAGSTACMSSGNDHPVPTSLAAAEAERLDRTYRLLRAWLLSYNVQAGDFGSWGDAATIGFRRITAGLLAQKLLEETEDESNPSPDLVELRALAPPTNFSQLIEDWLVANAHVHANVGTHGDFDFHLNAAMTLLNAFGTATHANGNPFLTTRSVRRLLVYSPEVQDCDANPDIAACGRTVPFSGNRVRKLSHELVLEVTIPETENHVMMVNTWAYLANQWVRQNPRNDTYLSAFHAANSATLVNEGSHLEQGLLSILSRFVKNGYFETNARPYQAYTVRALMQLAIFAEGEKVRNAALNALDYTAVRIAFGSFQGKRFAPMRRQWDRRNESGLYAGDYATVMFSFLTGAYAFDDNPTCTAPNCLWNAEGNQYRGFALDALASGYGVPAAIHDFMLRPDNGEEGFGAYTIAQARYSRNMYRAFEPARYPAPNVMGDPNLDELARSMTSVDSDFSYEPAPEHYFSTTSFFNSSGGRYNSFGVSGLGHLEDLLDVVSSDTWHSHDFLAKPSSVILPGGKLTWRSLGEGERVTVMMSGDASCDDGTGYCSANGPVYKNVTFGYSPHGSSPTKTPRGWAESETVALHGDAQARVLSAPDSGVHVLVTSLLGSGIGHWEVIPPTFTVPQVLQTAQEKNTALAVVAEGGTLIGQYRTVVSDELLEYRVFGTDTPYIRLESVDGNPVPHIDPVAYQDVVNSPLLLVRQVKADYAFTGIEYVRAMGDGLVHIHNPALGSRLTLDSRDHQNPTRIVSLTGESFNVEFDPSWLPPIQGSALPGPTPDSLVLTPDSSGTAQVQREYTRTGSTWTPGTLRFEATIAGTPAANAGLRVTLSNSATGTIQLGATALLADLAAAGETKLVFNVPADALAALQSNTDPVTLTLTVEGAAGISVHLAALRSTTYRSAPEGQSAIGRWDELWSTTAPTDLSANATVGEHSQRVCGGGYRSLESPSFNPVEFSWVSQRLAVDVRIPQGLPNPQWQGALQLYYFKQPEYVQSQYVGQVELTGLPAGEWVTVSFLLPQPIFDLFKQDAAGSSLQLAINADAASSECFQLDNLRFLGPLELNAPAVVEEGGAPPMSSAQRVFECESAQAWHAVQGADPVLVSSPLTGGSSALSIQVSNWTLLESDLFFTNQLSSQGPTLTFDVFTPPVNPDWPGEISLFVECPFLDLWNEHAGTVPVPAASGPTALSFPLAPDVAQALAGDNECRLRIAFNTLPEGGTFIMDSLRLEP